MKQVIMSFLLVAFSGTFLGIIVSCTNLGLNKACERLGNEMKYEWKYDNGCYLKKEDKWIKQ